jgi:CheY-like chemotaxis protein
MTLPRRGPDRTSYIDMPSRSAHVLLVDDSRMDIELTLDAFAERRFENRVHVAAGGEEALAYLFGQREFADRAQYPLPDLILLDLKMPGIDGHQVLRRIKAVDVLKRIPVIILSSSREEGDRAMGYDNGANSYIVKPVSFDGFLQVVQELDHYWFSLNVPPPDPVL